MPGILLAYPAPTFNRPRAEVDKRVRRPRPEHQKQRSYANHPDPTTTGELLLLAIKAGA